MGMTGLVGTPQWMAPEMMARKPYTPAVDVYSLGIVLWEILMEAQPFEGDNLGAIVHTVLIRNERPNIPHEVAEAHPEYVELVRQCWVSTPTDRPTAEEVFVALTDMQ